MTSSATRNTIDQYSTRTTTSWWNLAKRYIALTGEHSYETNCISKPVVAWLPHQTVIEFMELVLTTEIAHRLKGLSRVELWSVLSK